MKINNRRAERGLRAKDVLALETSAVDSLAIDPARKEELFSAKARMEEKSDLMFNDITELLFLVVVLAQEFPDDARSKIPPHILEKVKTEITNDQIRVRASSWSDDRAWARMIWLLDQLVELDYPRRGELVGSDQDKPWQLRPKELVQHMSILARERTKKEWINVVHAAKVLAQLFPEVKPQMQKMIRDSWEEIQTSLSQVGGLGYIADALLLAPDLRNSLHLDPVLWQKLQAEVAHESKRVPPNGFTLRLVTYAKIILAEQAFFDPEGKLRIIPKAQPVERKRVLPERSTVV